MLHSTTTHPAAIHDTFPQVLRQKLNNIMKRPYSLVKMQPARCSYIIVSHCLKNLRKIQLLSRIIQYLTSFVPLCMRQVLN